MGDLVKGVTFADGETVTAARLNALVDDATIKPGVVGTAELEDGSVTGAKLSGTLSIAIGNLVVNEGAVIIGNATDDGSEATLNSTAFEVVGAEIRLKDSGVTNAKLAGSITADKLAGSITSSQLTVVGTAGTYGSATQIPVITTDVAGRVVTVTTSTASPAVNTSNLTIPASQGGDITGTLSATPASLEISLRCVSAERGYATGDLLNIGAMIDQNSRNALAVYVTGTTATVRRSNDSNPLRIMRADTGDYADADSTKWQVQLRWR